MAFWSTQKLIARQKTDAIVLPFHEERAKQANYRLSMGDEYYVTPNSSDTDTHKHTRTQLGTNGTLSIPPGQFGFLLTEEIIAMPKDALGFISMETEIKFRGLVNVSGFHVDPGSNGKLIFSVFNAGPNAIQIHRGDPIFRLWVSSLNDADSDPRDGESHQGIPSSLTNNIPGTLESLQSMSTDLVSLNHRLDKYEGYAKVLGRICVGFSATAIVGVVALYLSIFMPKINGLPTADIENQNATESQSMGRPN